MQRDDGVLLRLVRLERPAVWPDRFPFSVPIVALLERLEFTAPVTFLVGENGCGKSTLLEAIACAAESITAGRESVSKDETLVPIRDLAAHFRLSWSKRTRRGFFMRAEDFFGYARRMSQLRDEQERRLAEIDGEYEGRSETARSYARMPHARELAEMRRYYGEDLDARSHGESYLAFFQARFVPEGLYLLDEPEAPLSPMRQLSFLVMLKSMVERRAQFIIATHSPIVMAFPGATILSCDDGAIHEIAYEELEHVTLARAFLQDPERYLRYLLADDS